MAATVYKPAWDVSIVYSGTTFKCTTASISVEIEQFETTNDQSEGAYEFGAGVKRISLSFECPVVSTTGTLPAEGSFAPATWAAGCGQSSNTSCSTWPRWRRGPWALPAAPGWPPWRRHGCRLAPGGGTR